jgi:cytochrome c oxidase subunit 3
LHNDTTAHAAHAQHPALAHHFDNLAQQQEAASLGMWVFLLTEILFFGGLFIVYSIYRVWYPDAFAAASHHLDIPLGTVNTAVLIGSSLTMALAVHAAQLNSRKGIMVFIALTMVLGAVFLGIKGV